MHGQISTTFQNKLSDRYFLMIIFDCHVMTAIFRPLNSTAMSRGLISDHFPYLKLWKISSLKPNSRSFFCLKTYVQN